MKLLLVAGARPNFMKVAPVHRAAVAAGHEPILLHTGQHYDEQMSAAFFRDLGLPDPDYHLGVGSGSHAQQTARIMSAFEPVLLDVCPDWLVLVGDVNSTLACALVAVKLKEQTGAHIAHVEAGLRSCDWRMPEEVNRVVTDCLSDLLLTHSAEARTHLIAEGIPPERIAFVGNVMIDTLFAQLPSARALNVPQQYGLCPGHYVLATMHRPSNVDDASALQELVSCLTAVSDRIPVVWPIHPRTRAAAERAGIDLGSTGLILLDPVGYNESVALQDGAALVLTDSGGLQEETTALGVPCITLRERTERPITITHGTNRLAPWPLRASTLLPLVEMTVAARRAAASTRPPGWDGRAAERVITALTQGTPVVASSAELTAATV